MRERDIESLWERKRKRMIELVWGREIERERKKGEREKWEWERDKERERERNGDWKLVREKERACVRKRI